MKHIVIGTRTSKLAMIQTQWVIEQIQQQKPDLEILIKPIHTTGDAKTDIPLTQIGGDGVFVMEIERALLQNHIHLAVHSLKDLPTTQPDGLCISTVGRREDARDVLIMNGQDDLESLIESRKTERMRIGTCSLRRSAQIRALFPEVEILPLRGNVDTRLRKLDEGGYDGIVLAAAGLHRLSKHERLGDRMNYLPIEAMMPAPGQGALALELRDEPELQSLIAPLRNVETQATTSAERMFMRWLGSGCYLPVGAHGTIANELLILKGLVISMDGQQQVRVERSIPWTPETPLEYAKQLGVHLAEQALARGAARIIRGMDTIKIEEQQNV